MGNYVEKNLREGDTVVAKAEFTWIPMIPAAILAILILIIGGKIWGFGWGFLIAVVIVAVRALGIASNELGVTNKNIVGKTGVILNKSLDARLSKIDNFSVSETLGGKIFGYATIQIFNAQVLRRKERNGVQAHCS